MSVSAPAFAGKPGGGGTSGSPGLNATIAAFDRTKSPGVWTKGNTAGYAELQAIPFRLNITGGPSDEVIQSLETDFDHANSGVAGIQDMVTTPALANQSFTPGASPSHNFAICGAPVDTTPLPPTGTGATPPCTTIPWVPVGGSQSCQSSLTSGTPPASGAYIQGPYCKAITGGITEGYYVWHNVTVPANGSITMVWGALLALGSHLYNGSALHGSIGPVVVSPDNSISFGAKDVPIPVNQIIATSTDKKVNGSDGPVQLTIGQTATVSITSSAFGPKGSSQQLTIDDTLPPCLTYNDSATPAPASAPAVGSSGHVIFGPFTVAGGSSVTVQFSVKAAAVDANCANTEITTSNQAPPVSDTVPTPVGGVSHLTISKDCGAASPTAGSSATHTIDFGNDGTASASNVTITDAYSAGLSISNVHETLNGASVTPSYTTSGNTLTFTIGTLAPGDTGEITYTVTYPTTATSDGAQTFSDTASIKVSGTTVNSSTCSRSITYHPDLTLQKACTTSGVPLGSQTTHTLTVTNKSTGTAPATSASITDSLPSGESYVANSVKVNGTTLYPTTDPNAGKSTLTIPLGTINPGDTDTVTYSVTVTSTDPNNLKDTATVSSAQTDLDSSDNTDDCTTGVVTVDVTVAKQCASTATPGGSATQLITFTNDGTAAANGVTVTDVLNSGETPTSVSLDGTQIWTPSNPGTSVTSSSGPGQGQTTLTFTPSGGTLPAKSSHVLSVTFTVPATATAAGVQTFSDTASIASTNETDTAKTNNTSTCGTPVDYEPDLHLSKSSCQTAAVSGGELSYTLTYSNTGTAPANPASLVDTLPTVNGQPGVTVADAHGGTVSPAANPTTVTWAVGPIAPDGASHTQQLDLIVTAAKDSSLINHAQITSGTDSASATAAAIPVTGPAAASGRAWSLDATLFGTEVLDHIHDVTSSTASSQPSADAAIGPVTVPPGLVSVSALTTSTNSDVNDTSAPSSAKDISTSQVLSLNLLNGLVTADAVRGVSTSEAYALGATYGSDGSYVANLKVNGQPVTNVSPNTTIYVQDPTAALLGEPCDAAHTNGCLAKVVVYEESGTSSLAALGSTNQASHSVNMLHVTLLKALSGQPAGLDVTVAHAQSAASYASGYACGAKFPTVEGRAYTGFVQGVLNGTLLASGLVGDVNLPRYGGSNTSSTTITVPGVATADTAANSTTGTLTTFSHATASSKVTNPTVTVGSVTIHADALQEQATSVNGGSTNLAPYGVCNGPTSTCFQAVFANLTINGQSIPQQSCLLPLGPNPATASPAGVNCVQDIPQGDGSIVEIIVNEQSPTPPGTDSGQANALHVRVLKNGTTTAEVVVTHAESGAFPAA